VQLLELKDVELEKLGEKDKVIEKIEKEYKMKLFKLGCQLEESQKR